MDTSKHFLRISKIFALSYVLIVFPFVLILLVLSINTPDTGKLNNVRGLLELETEIQTKESIDINVIDTNQTEEKEQEHQCESKVSLTVDGLHISNVECKEGCSDNGICCDGICHCFPGYKGSFCQIYNKCHNVNCGHGVCNIHTGQCECNEGYFGTDCEIKRCLHGSIYDVVTDKCICMDGWGGSDCSSCAKGPVGQKNRTYVCCPIHEKVDHYMIISVPSSNLHSYLGGFMTLDSCVLPNKPTKDGLMLDCGCDIQGKEDEELTRIDSKMFNTMNGRTIINNMQKITSRKYARHSNPEFISNLLEGKDKLMKSMIKPCYCNEWSDSGIYFLVSLTILLGIIIFILIIWYWRTIKSKPNEKIPKLSKRKN